MNTFYHHLGFIVFWGVVLSATWLGLLVLWQEAKWFQPIRRRIKHFWLALRLPFTKEEAQYSRIAARYYIRMAGATNWASWERNILANILKRARKRGFTE